MSKVHKALKDGSQLEIRSAKTGDEALLCAFIHELAVFERLEDQVTATEELIRQNLLSQDAKKGEAILAFIDAKPVGFAVFFHNFSTFIGRPGLYLEDLFVKPEFRGLGIGKILLTHLAAIAVERKCARFEWSVLDWNVGAIGFYQKLGARPMSEWTIFRLHGEELTKLAKS